MSVDRIFTADPTRMVRREGVPSPNSVRVYTSAPGRVSLQIRRVKDLITCRLSVADARRIGAALIEAADDLEAT